MNARHPFFSATLFTALLLVFSQMALAGSSNKWRLEISGSADSDGTIVLRFTPEGGTAFETTTMVSDGTRENMVAKTLTESLKEQLPEDGYKVERDDGEDVLVKKRHGAANFGIEVVSNTVKGVRINRDKE